MRFGIQCTKITNNRGEVRYRRNGRLHRVGGPALDCPSGYQVWYLNGDEHREDGPARIRPSGIVEYFLNGIEYSQHEYYVELHRRRAVGE